MSKVCHIIYTIYKVKGLSMNHSTFQFYPIVYYILHFYVPVNLFFYFILKNGIIPTSFIKLYVRQGGNFRDMNDKCTVAWAAWGEPHAWLLVSLTYFNVCTALHGIGMFSDVLYQYQYYLINELIPLLFSSTVYLISLYIFMNFKSPLT